MSNHVQTVNTPSSEMLHKHYYKHYTNVMW